MEALQLESSKNAAVDANSMTNLTARGLFFFSILFFLNKINLIFFEIFLMLVIIFFPQIFFF